MQVVDATPLNAIMGNMALYGERFKELRTLKGWSTFDVAERLYGDRALQGTVSNIESSARVPRAETIVKHARALSCQPSDLLQGVDTVYDEIRAGKLDSPAKESGASIGPDAFRVERQVNTSGAHRAVTKNRRPQAKAR